MAINNDASVKDIHNDDTGTDTPVFNDRGLEKLGIRLKDKFEIYKSDRLKAEQQWMKNLRQYKGQYDPEIERAIGGRRSKAYPKITRVKCIGMLSKLMHLMFSGGSEKNWTIASSPVPNLHKDDLQTVLDELLEGKDPNAELQDDEIEEAILAFSKLRARNLEIEIEDQLAELGGSRTQGFEVLARKVLKSGIIYGMGVLRGPFVVEREKRTWTRDSDGKVVATVTTMYRPKFEFVDIWNYYPDLSATTLEQMDGQFQKVLLSKHTLIGMKNGQEGDFIAKQIDKVLTDYPDGNYKQSTTDIQLRSIGLQSNVKATADKYEALIWSGYVTGKQIQEAGIEIDEKRVNQDVKVEVWIIEDIPIRALIDPWSELLKGATIDTYHHFIFEEDDTTILGEGLPSIVRDSQLGVCAASRMTLDNGSIQRNIEVNTALLKADQEIDSVEPDKVWLREDTGQSITVPAVRAIELPMNLAEMNSIITLFKEFSDEETFVSQNIHKELQKGPSEPFRNAAGASMLRSESALPFKDVVRNFDMFTVSVINACVKFNRALNDKPSIRGDFQTLPRGATSLIAKEVRGIQLDSLATTLTDNEKPYIDFRRLALERIKVRDLDVEVVVSETEAKRIDDNLAQQSQKQQQQADEMFRVTIRKELADVFKNLAQGNKNQAGADATTVQLILEALEKGLQADDITRPREATVDRGTPVQPRAGNAALAANAQGQVSAGPDGLAALPQRVGNAF